MTYDKAIATIQDHFDELEALPEDHVRFGDAIVSITDYVALLEKALDQTSKPNPMIERAGE